MANAAFQKQYNIYINQVVIRKLRINKHYVKRAMEGPGYCRVSSLLRQSQEC